MFLTKEELLKVRELETFTIKTLEDGVFKGVELRCMPMRAIEQAELLEVGDKHKNPVFHSALWLVYTLIDDAGNRMFASGDLDALLRVMDSRELNHLSSQIIKKLVKNEVAEKVKNSDTPATESTEDSSSVSQ